MNRLGRGRGAGRAATGRCLLFLLVVAGWWSGTASAVEGLVARVDGRKVRGDIAFTNEALVVTSAEGSAVIDVKHISHAWFTTNAILTGGKGTGNGLLGVYYAFSNLTGKAVMRLDETVDFDWQEREPTIGIHHETFSARWMGQLEAPATDAYTIYFATDEGGRIYLDDNLLADDWAGHTFTETNVTVNLRAGERRKLKLEYYELLGPARARLSWSTPSMPKTVIPQDRLYAASFDEGHRADMAGLAGGHGLLGTYYDGDETGSNSFTRVDPEIDVHWNGQPPAPGISARPFAVRWLGNLLVTNEGDYKFYIMAGEPLRLFINDQLISQAWWVALQQTATAHLKPGGRCELRLEVRVTNNVMPMRLSWSGPDFPRTPLSREHLTPAIAPSAEPAEGRGPALPAGVVLRNGVIIDAPLQSGSATSLRLRGVAGRQPISMAKVSRIHVRPITRNLAQALPADRAGVLLKNRDFIDGEFAGLENGRVKIESVLFGERTFDLKDVVAIVLRGQAPPMWRCAITTIDGAVLYGKGLRISPASVALEGAPEFSLSAAEVTEIVRSEGR